MTNIVKILFTYLSLYYTLSLKKYKNSFHYLPIFGLFWIKFKEHIKKIEKHFKLSIS